MAHSKPFTAVSSVRIPLPMLEKLNEVRERFPYVSRNGLMLGLIAAGMVGETLVGAAEARALLSASVPPARGRRNSKRKLQNSHVSNKKFQ
jgi:hypothetical protein